MAGGEDVGHGTFGMRYEVPIQPVKAIGAAIAKPSDRRAAASNPKVRGGAIVADDEARLVADIDADRQEIQQAIRKVEDALVEQGLQLMRSVFVYGMAFQHYYLPLRPSAGGGGPLSNNRVRLSVQY